MSEWYARDLANGTNTVVTFSTYGSLVWKREIFGRNLGLWVKAILPILSMKRNLSFFVAAHELSSRQLGRSWVRWSRGLTKVQWVYAMYQIPKTWHSVKCIITYKCVALAFVLIQIMYSASPNTHLVALLLLYARMIASQARRCSGNHAKEKCPLISAVQICARELRNSVGSLMPSILPETTRAAPLEYAHKCPWKLSCSTNALHVYRNVMHGRSYFTRAHIIYYRFSGCQCKFTRHSSTQVSSVPALPLSIPLLEYTLWKSRVYLTVRAINTVY